MMNTILTLPLDVLAARSQTEVEDDITPEDSTQSDCKLTLSPHHLPASKVTKEIMDHIWDDADSLGRIDDRCGNAEAGGE
eukprot:CAMPEP_0198267530 /NCGR_PEP_ID=MMETSP1447-20131203/33517_1 /TAXON_ID=420782 /ORGANISM="Chaetoceros dichaeta, Strain CCMP1751" /LENGTH=79 /DNA_ID=CAMNT_0043958175 /DNA_START=1 /DNA_END=237 /DNA_ORIENTATION=+